MSILEIILIFKHKEKIVKAEKGNQYMNVINQLNHTQPNNEAAVY